MAVEVVAPSELVIINRTLLSCLETSRALFLSLLFFMFLGSGGVAVSSALAQKELARLPVNLHGVSFLKKEGWVVGRLGKIFHTTDGGESWEEQKSGTDLLLTAVDFVDRTHGWVVGERGVILHSEDGGATWKQQQSSVPSVHRGTSYGAPTPKEIEPARAIGGPHSESFPSLNTESSIVTQGAPLMAGTEATMTAAYPLFDVEFIGRERGWAVGHWGTIFFTEDGGRHWVERSLSLDLEERRGPVEPAALHDVIDPETGEAVAKAGQLLTKELIAEIARRGISGVRIREDVVLNTVFFLDQAHGWIGGEGGLVLRTEDGGKTWERGILPYLPFREDEEASEIEMSPAELAKYGVITPPPSVYDLCFVSPLQGWAVGQDGAIAYTRDGGRQWEFQLSGAREALYSIGVMKDRGWIVGDKGTVLVSTDSGMQWERMNLGLEYRFFWLRRLAVVSGNHAFLVGADGLVLISNTLPE